MKPDLEQASQVASGDILAVDDNPANLLAIEAALTGVAGTLVKVDSGERALKALLERDFAVVLLDVQMPGMDGFETARLIRSRQRSRHVPIIFVTAFSRDDEDILKGYSLGAVDFLFKPIVSEVLRAKVSVFVALREHAVRLQQQEKLLREHEQRAQEQRFAEKRRQELEEMNRRLETADRRKDEFLAMLGHELRNPIAPVLNGIALLTHHLADDARLQKTLGAMERQTRHLARLVDDLLEVSRVTSGKVELRREPLQIGPVIEQARAMSAPLMEEKHHELLVDVQAPETTVVGDSVRLAQVVSNLLNNAARYTPEGGHVSLTSRPVDGHVEIQVKDDGQGIPEELVDSVFDMFVQATPGGGGLGIGLTLVQRLVTMHQGTVKVHSEGTAKGCTFTVTLPVSGNEQARGRGATESHVPAPSQDALRVAVVEDNEDIRDTLADLLSMWGHEVATAENGEKGVELVLSMRPDVALADIGMPVLDGYGFAAKVRETMPPEVLYLVAMTGFGQAEAKQKAMEAGFDAHLVKPVGARSLESALKQVRARRGRASEEKAP